jgi:hypothetical protein
MSKRKKGNKMISLGQPKATAQVPQNEEINSDTENVQFISEGIGLEDFVTIEGKNSNNVVKGEENEMNKAQETQRTHNEVVVDATQQKEQAKVASAVKKVEAKQGTKLVEGNKEKTAAPTTEQLVSMINDLKAELKQAKESKEEIIPVKAEGGKEEMYKQTAAMNSTEVVPDNTNAGTVTISKNDLNNLIKEAVENAQKANANLPAPQVAIKEEVKEEPKKEEVVEKKESKEESEENDYSFFFGAAVGAAAVYGGQKLYEYLNDDSAADDASEAFSLISDMF